ncbi:MAG: LysM peptidoglycan-binding domain-containing protein [Planctomycetes bacterium]|nr:LysM peptidoglycan-binding domain-containing protein [Planctomycetota bacterium]
MGLMIVAIAVARLIEVELDTSRGLPPLVVQGAEDTPELEGLGIEFADAPTHGSGAPLQAEPVEVEPTQPQPVTPEQRTYTVEPGDTLGAISRKVYGTSRHWKAIHEANRDRVPRPEALRSGTELRIPPQPRAK